MFAEPWKPSTGMTAIRCRFNQSKQQIAKSISARFVVYCFPTAAILLPSHFIKYGFQANFPVRTFRENNALTIR